jgi:hypothetical protein
MLDQLDPTSSYRILHILSTLDSSSSVFEAQTVYPSRSVPSCEVVVALIQCCRNSIIDEPVPIDCT